MVVPLKPKSSATTYVEAVTSKKSYVDVLMKAKPASAFRFVVTFTVKGLARDVGEPLVAVRLTHTVSPDPSVIMSVDIAN